jgi:hypothetical protein
MRSGLVLLIDQMKNKMIGMMMEVVVEVEMEMKMIAMDNAINDDFVVHQCHIQLFEWLVDD